MWRFDKEIWLFQLQVIIFKVLFLILNTCPFWKVVILISVKFSCDTSTLLKKWHFWWLTYHTGRFTWFKTKADYAAKCLHHVLNVIKINPKLFVTIVLRFAAEVSFTRACFLWALLLIDHKCKPGCSCVLYEILVSMH